MPKIAKLSIIFFALSLPASASAALQEISPQDTSCGLKLFDSKKKLVGFVNDSSEFGFVLELKESGQSRQYFEKKVTAKIKTEGTYSIGDRVTAQFETAEGQKAKLVNKVTTVCISALCDLANVSSTLVLSGPGRKPATYRLTGTEQCFGAQGPVSEDPTPPPYLSGQPEKGELPETEFSSDSVPAPIPLQ